MSSLPVTPPGRLSSSRILAVLLPSRASGLAALALFPPLGAFLAGVAFFPDLPLAGATGRATWRAGGLLAGFGLLLRCRGRGGGFFCDLHAGFSLARLVPRDDIDHSDWLKNASGIWKRSCAGQEAMERRDRAEEAWFLELGVKRLELAGSIPSGRENRILHGMEKK